MHRDTYLEFVREAFIDPIRSVLIVDDDYPTFDEILAAEIADDPLEKEATLRRKGWKDDPQRIIDVIAHFRSPDRPLLVDIHDGSNVDFDEETCVVRHLHQSDLLILDFQLDETQSGDKAISIARSIMRNNHFNMVVVHTRTDLDLAFNDMLMGLLGETRQFDSGDDRELALEALAEIEIEAPDVVPEIKAAIGFPQYLFAIRNPGDYVAKMYSGAEPFALFKQLCDKYELAAEKPKRVLNWALDEFEKTNRTRMNPKPPPSLNWSGGPQKWIRSDTIFVSFTNKDPNVDLRNQLLEALVDWAPGPSRLFLTKLRGEIDDIGVAAESLALADRLALAEWYLRLLDGDGAARETLICESIGRHSEQLLDQVKQGVEQFAKRLVEADAAFDRPNVEIVKDYFRVSLDNPVILEQAQAAHNAFSCSRQSHAWHLSTGHVFKASGYVWVCLSPACDMVPGQKSGGQYREAGEHLPFLAVRLRAMTLDQRRAIRDIQSNRYIFLKIDEEVEAYCLNDPDQPSSLPLWYVLFASRGGELENGKYFNISRVTHAGDALTLSSAEAEVVSQLRYEYALNLAQRLTATFSRIGLDFTGKDLGAGVGPHPGSVAAPR